MAAGSSKTQGSAEKPSAPKTLAPVHMEGRKLQRTVARQHTIEFSSADNAAVAGLPWEGSPDDLAIIGPEGKIIGVLIHPDEYMLLRAVADAASDPNELRMVFEGEESDEAALKDTLSFTDV